MAEPRLMKNAPPPDRLRALEGLVLDCDGVLTPGDLYYDEGGRRLLRFNARDGFGLAALCRNAKFPVGILSGRPTDIAEQRLRELGITQFAARCKDKSEGLALMCERLGIAQQQCAYIGDDLPDLRAFAVAGVAIAVADAAVELREAADWVTLRPGGRGAVREVCEAILQARGDWQRLVSRLRGEPVEDAREH